MIRVAPALQHRQRMTPQADGAIHEDTAFVRLQECERFACHHRFVTSGMRHRPRSDKCPRVCIGERLALKLGDKSLVVPHFEIVVLTEDVDLANHRCRLAQSGRYDHTALTIDLSDLAVEVHPVEKLQARWMGGWNLRELGFNVRPYRHRVNSNGVAEQTGNEQLAPVFIFDERAEPVGDLESPPVINFRRRVAPKHARLLHFFPKKSTAILEDDL